MQHLHAAIGHLVPYDAEVFEFANHFGGVLGQNAHERRVVVEMAAAHGVETMARGRIRARNRGLHSAFRHHGVGVAHAQLGGDQRLHALARGCDGRPAARAAAADDEKVGLIVGLGQKRARQLRAEHGVRFQDGGHFRGQLLAPVRPDANGALGSRRIVGVVFREHILPLFRVHRRIDGLPAERQIDPLRDGSSRPASPVRIDIQDTCLTPRSGPMRGRPRHYCLNWCLVAFMGWLRARRRGRNRVRSKPPYPSPSASHIRRRIYRS